MPLEYIIGAGLNLLGGAAAAQQNVEAQRLANEGNMKLAQYQYNANLDMWRRQTEYNTPANQVRRTIEAGLNPNLVYGHGQYVNSASPAPQYQAPTLQAYTNMPNIFGGAVDAALEIRRNIAEVKKAESDAKKAEADANKSMTDAGYTGSLKTQQDIINEFERERQGYSTNLLRLKNDYENLQSKYYHDYVEFQRSGKEAEAKTAWQNYENVKLHADEIQATIDNLKAQKNLTTAQTATELERPALVRAQTNTESYKPTLMASEVNRNYATSNYMMSAAENQLAQAAYKRLETEWLPAMNNQTIEESRERIAGIQAEVARKAYQNKLDAQRTKMLFYQTLSEKVGAEYAEKLNKANLMEKYANTTFRMAESYGTVLKANAAAADAIIPF